MLRLMRKYQKFFYVLVTGIIVIVFVFFGAGARQQQQTVRQTDRQIGVKMDGSPLMLQEVQQMSRFFNAFPNIFDDGVITKDLIETGVAQMLAREYFDDLKEELGVRVAHIQKAAFYRHPAAKFISARKVWQEFKPEIVERVEFVKTQEAFNADTLEALMQLFLAQKEFTPDHLKRVLLYQQSQYPMISIDNRLYYEDLSLFGFKNPVDWFGHNFVDLASQFIINAAALAEQKGYQVTEGEAFSELLINAHTGVEQLGKDYRRAIAVDGDYFKNQLKYLGMSQKEVAGLWRKVLLFRKYFNDVGGSVFMDNQYYEALEGGAAKKANITLYQLPEHLRLGTMNDLLLLQFYISCVSSNGGLALPSSYYSVEEIAARMPALVRKTYEVRVAVANRDDAVLKIPERHLWKWQVKNTSWNKILDEFPQVVLFEEDLNFAGADHLEILERLPEELRARIDHFSRNEIISEGQDAIRLCLQQQDKKLFTWQLYGNGRFEGPAGIYDGAALCRLLEENQPLSYYTQDNIHYYDIELVSVSSKKEIAAFGEAREKHLLDEALDELLRARHVALTIEKPELFSGAFEEEREKVGRVLFAGLFDEMDAMRSSLKIAEEAPDFYLKYRFYKMMEDFRNKIKLQGEWRPEKIKKTVALEENDLWLRNALKGPERSRSLLQVGADMGNIRYYKVHSIVTDNEKLSAAIECRRQALANEAKVCLAQKIAGSLKDEKNIVLPAARAADRENE